MKKYLEIVEDVAQIVYRRFDITNQSENNVKNFQEDIIVNFNYEHYSIRRTDSNDDLPLGIIKKDTKHLISLLKVNDIKISEFATEDIIRQIEIKTNWRGFNN